MHASDSTGYRRQYRGLSGCDLHAQDMLREQFPGLSGSNIDKSPDQLRDPLSSGFVTHLIVAENAQGVSRALKQPAYFSDLHVSYLELIITA